MQNNREKLETIRAKIEILRYINPVNLKASQVAFLEDNKNPIFEYQSVPPEYQEYLAQLQDIEFSSEPGDELYELARQAAVRSIELVQAVATDSFTPISLEGHPVPTAQELILAEHRLINKQPSLNKGEPIPAEEMLQAIRDELQRLALPRWSAEFSEGVSRCYVASNQRKVFLRPDANFWEKDKVRLVAHEVWGHVLRSANGYEQPLPILGTSMPEAGVTEEGITNYLEQRWGVYSPEESSSRHILAIDIAQKGSFSDVFTAIQGYCKNEASAFTATVRVKRGISDTSQPGGYTKDVSYLRGELAVTAYMQSGGSLEKLYVGKIGLEHLSLVNDLREQGLVSSPRWLPCLPKT